VGGLLENFVSSINIAFTEKKSLLLSIYIFFSCCLHCTPVWVRLPVWVPPFCCVNLLARPKVYAHPPTNTHTQTHTPTQTWDSRFCSHFVNFMCIIFANLRCLFMRGNAQSTTNTQHTTYNIQTHTYTGTRTHTDAANQLTHTHSHATGERYLLVCGCA